MISKGMDEKGKRNRWWIALAALVVEVGFALLMLSLSSDRTVWVPQRFIPVGKEMESRCYCIDNSLFRV